MKKRILLISVLFLLVSFVYAELKPGDLYINDVLIPFDKEFYKGGYKEEGLNINLIIKTSKDIYDVGEKIELASESRIINNENSDLKGYLFISIEKNVFEDYWNGYEIVNFDSDLKRLKKPRIISSKNVLDLDKIFKAVTLSRAIVIKGPGKYRAVAKFEDENGNTILKANYEFNVVEPKPKEVYTSLTIATLKDEYYTGENIELTDPQEFIDVPNIPLKEEKKLEFGNIKSLNELGLSEIDKYVIIENSGGLSYKYIGINEKTINFNINVNDIKLISGEKYDGVMVDDLPTGTKEGEPALPVKIFRIEIPKNSEVKSVNIKSGNYINILTELNIIPVAQAATWATPDTNIVPNTNIYNMEDFFPKKILSYDYGEDNDKGYVNIKFYPMQYIPKLKKTIIMNNVVISIQYSAGPLRKIATFWEVTNAESIIITHPDFKQAADKLAQFHINDEQIDTKVYETTWINTNYQAAEDPDYNGCKDAAFCEQYTDKGYNYELAKKIVAFLRDTQAHPNLKYVTLIGEAVHMPPSYYASNPQDSPTDFFYASPDYDLVPNYGIGRLSVNTLNEANFVVDKTIKWYKNQDKSWFNKAALFGGDAFNSYGVFIGELITAGAIDRNYFDGMQIEKNFQSLDRLGREYLLDTLKGGYGLVYHIDHGSGTSTTGVNTNDLTRLSSNNNLPIFVSIACSNGMYDSNIVENGEKSFSESVLLSPAGGIAYIGGDRSNYGGVPAVLDQGRLDMTIEQPYMQEMLNLVFESYKNGAEKLGDLYGYAAKNYAIKKTISTTGGTDQLTLFAFTLQGDAALKIPKNEYSDSYAYPTSAAINPDEYRESSELRGNAPYYSLDKGESFSAETITKSNKLNVKLKELDSEIFVDNKKIDVVNEKVTYSFTPDFRSGQKEYQMISESDNKKEGWFYIQAERFIDGIDLEATSIDWDWPVLSNKKNDIQLSIKNLGNKNAENVIISLYYKSANGADDFKPIDTISVSKISALSRIELFIPWIPEKGGDYKLKLEVSTTNDINPDNDNIENFIDVTSNAPDVNVYIRWKDKVIQNEDNWIEIEIENEGVKEAKNVKVSLFDITDNEKLIYEKDGISISKQSEGEVFFPWKPEKTGYRKLKAVVECDGDENLDNNEDQRNFYVVPNKPDVTSYLEWINKAKVNEILIVKGAVTNIGVKKAVNVIASLYKKEWFKGKEMLILIEKKNVKDLEEDEKADVEFSWIPTKIEWTNLVMVVGADGDDVSDNDKSDTYVKVMPEKPELYIYVEYNENNFVVDKNNELNVVVSNDGFADAKGARLTLEVYEEKEDVATLLKKEERNIDVYMDKQEEAIFNYMPKTEDNLIFELTISHPDDYDLYNNNAVEGKKVVARSLIKNSQGVLEGYLLMKLQKYNGEKPSESGGGGGSKPVTKFSSSYGEKQLVRIYADRDKQKELLKMDLDIASFKKNEYIDVVMPESQLNELSNKYSIKILPINKDNLFDKSKYEEAYHTYDSMVNDLQQIEKDHPDIAKLYNIGDSVEGRNILAMKISDNVAQQENEPEVLIDGNHHAREIMTVEIPMHLINYLVSNYNSNNEIKNIVDENQIWIIPMVNPDGHVYVETNDIWWRKNRKNNGDGSFGIDLNRNYGYKWGYDDIGSSSYPDSETYRGSSAFSEPETQAIKNLVEGHNFVWDISYHSYGQLFLYPFGYDFVAMGDNENYRNIGESLKENIPDIIYGTPAEVLYPANGGTFDWMYGERTEKKAMHGFSFEINTEEEGGFRPEPSLINPTFNKHLPIILELIKAAEEFPLPAELSQPGWTDYMIVADDLNENNKRTINEYDTLSLDKIWNEKISDEEELRIGDYRIYASFLDAKGNIIIKDNKELVDSYEFKVR